MLFSFKISQEKSKNENNLVNISVVISAKNESRNINGLIEHLSNLEYPPELYEVLLVDDNSIDDTLNLIKEKTEHFANFSVFSIKDSGKSGKREALSFAIHNSKYPYILVTDADCRPEKNWIKSFSNKFIQGYDFIFGVAPFYQQKELVNQISCFENLRGQMLSFTMASVNFPYTAAARSFGFSKSAFDLVEGYSKTNDTLSGDDDLLLREAVKAKLKIGTVVETGSFVYSESKKTFSEYFHQKARHTQTSFHYLKRHRLILGCWHTLNLVFLFSPFLMLINPLYGILFPAKFFIDIVVVKSIQKKFSYKFSVFEIFYLQILYEFFLIIHFFRARFTNVKWK